VGVAINVNEVGGREKMWGALRLLVYHKMVPISHQGPIVRVEKLLLRGLFVRMGGAQSEEGEVATPICCGTERAIGREPAVKDTGHTCILLVL
jgi:hypothetical protein